MSFSYIKNIVNTSFYTTLPIFLIWCIARFIYIHKIIKEHNKNDNTLIYDKKREIILCIFIFYIIWLYQITVYRYGIDFNSIFNRKSILSNVNLIPIIETINMYKYGTIWHFTYNVMGNIMWFVPLGLLLPFIYNKKGILKVICFSFLISLSIEILQFILNTGISDIDDIIFNVLGAVIGYNFYKIFNYIISYNGGIKSK